MFYGLSSIGDSESSRCSCIFLSDPAVDFGVHLKQEFMTTIL